MFNKNELSDIYSDKVLLKEDSNVVAPKGKFEITKGETLPHTKEGPFDNVDLEEPEEAKKFSDGPEPKKKVTENMSTKNTTENAYEGAFEKLFRSTLNEEEVTDGGNLDAGDVEVPTSDEDFADELGGEGDESSDLATELRSVIDHLESILDKLSHGETHSEEEEVEGEDEGQEEPFEESVEYNQEEEGHALVNMKKGKDLIGPKGKFNTNGVKARGGKASNVTLKSEPSPKDLGKTADLGAKKKNEVNSTVKVGDFFK